VPVRWKGTEADLAKDLLDRRISPTDMINAVAASTACRSAVMDGTVLDSSMAAWLCKAALELPDPHCPHGRPVYTTITRRQLFDLVRRT
ncbi:MAG: DNA mismatch repair protein MutL, partial [Treponema sp.]|nr:DNA mismatch repair protein MutL [Treponema sp.]